jgi:hypothetical protein
MAVLALCGTVNQLRRGGCGNHGICTSLKRSLLGLPHGASALAARQAADVAGCRYAGECRLPLRALRALLWSWVSLHESGLRRDKVMALPVAERTLELWQRAEDDRVRGAVREAPLRNLDAVRQ